MSAQVLAFDQFRAALVSSDRDVETLTALRNDFEHSFVILDYAVRKDLASFSLSTLAIPTRLDRIVPSPIDGSTQAQTQASVAELATFEEVLNDRLALLAQNTCMLRQIWGLNKRTRLFRELELRCPHTREEVIAHFADLIACLSSGEEQEIVASLRRGLEGRVAVLRGLGVMPSGG